MVRRPAAFNAFEFVVLSSQRAAQLTRGCTPKIDSIHKIITVAQMEVAEGKIALVPAVVRTPV